MRVLLRTVVVVIALCSPALAQYVGVNGTVQLGGRAVTLGGLPPTNTKWMQTFPGATVSVCVTGTSCASLAPIYTSSTGGAKSNPFPADATTAAFQFFVAPGIYDIRFSGMGILTPWTISNVSIEPNGLGNGITVIDATGMNGADMGVKIAAALTKVYAAGGGTVDARGFACPTNCHIGTANLTLGDGTHPGTVYLPAGTITRDVISGTGLSAQILYNSHFVVRAENTTITGPSDVTAVQQAYNSGSVTEAYWFGGRISDTGTVVPGSAALQVGGPNSAMPLATSTNMAYPGYIGADGGGAGSYYGNFPGALAHVAIYHSALSAARIAAHYAATSSVANYESVIESDSPYGYWPLNDTSGTTATALVGGSSFNGTYTGTVTLNSQAWVVGGSTAALFDGATGYVTLPSEAWFTSGDWTVEGWAYTTGLGLGDKGLFSSNTSLFGDGTWIYQETGNHGFSAYVPTGTPQIVSNPQYELPLNTWAYFVWTYKNGNAILYINGQPLSIGTDVLYAQFNDLIVSGADIGTLMNGQHGCICYNKFNNVFSAGASEGIKTENSSGYAFGVNSNQWTSGNIGGAIGLWDSGTDKFTYSYLDFENNQSSNGAILYSGPDGNNAGTNYIVGDTVRPTGGDSTAVLKVTGVGTGGYVTALSVTIPGTTYGNVQSVATTTLTGVGTGLKVDLVVSAANLLISNGGSLVNNPYEEASGPDYLCGSGNSIIGAWGSFSGGIYQPNYCTGPVNPYNGGASDFVFGTNSPPRTLGLYGANSYITFNSSQMYDGNGSYAMVSIQGYSSNLYMNGPVFNGTASLIYGFWGHNLWEVGVSKPHAGTVSTGKTTFGQIPDPTFTSANLTPFPTGSSTSANYGLVCNDGNGGHTLPVSPTVNIANAPAVLGAFQTLSLSAGGSGYTQSDVGAHFTITNPAGTGSTAQGTITQVNGGSGTGAVTGISSTPYVAGSQYATGGYPSAFTNGLFATSGGHGAGLTVNGTSSYIEITYPQTDGCQSWTVLEGDTAHAVHFGTQWVTSSTNASANIFDYGGTTVAVTWDELRNTTGDVSVAGTLAEYGGLISAGLISLSTGSGSHTFGTAYGSAPVCTANDTTNGTQTFTLTAATGSISIAGGHNSDVISWHCQPASN